MTLPVQSSASATRAYSFVLLGTWAQIPLDTPEHARAAAQKLVRERVGRDDRLASVRRSTRDELVTIAANAALAGADGLWLSLEIVPGIPLPAAMITSWSTMPEEGRDGLARFAAQRPNGEVIESAVGPVVRSRTTGVSPIDDMRQSLSLEYTVPSPTSGRMLVIQGSAPIIDEGEPYTRLFDLIVDTLRWGELKGTA